LVAGPSMMAAGPRRASRIARIAPRCRGSQGSRPLPHPVVAPVEHLQCKTCVCAALVHPAALGGRRDLAVVRQVHLACVFSVDFATTQRRRLRQQARGLWQQTRDVWQQTRGVWQQIRCVWQHRRGASHRQLEVVHPVEGTRSENGGRSRLTVRRQAWMGSRCEQQQQWCGANIRGWLCGTEDRPLAWGKSVL